jgi:ArsR family transcriptional regulator, arsenate/arsenite/antimonite-responsive transcriptional repressor
VLISAEHDVIRLLADPLRARIVELLAEGAACTCHLVTDTGATQSNVSNHLRALRQAGVVVAEPRGRYTYYRLRPEVLAGAAGYLSSLAERARDSDDVRREC